ncbi:MAG: protein translocase subunit SecD, partial [Microcoleaceae cyanobacterium]
MQKQTSWLGLIIIVVLASLIILFTIPLKLGLDLQGGSQITMQLKTSADVPVIDEKVSEAVLRIVENRVNALGVSEAIVQTLGKEQIIVQLPGVSDPEQAERVLGGTAQLDFREQLPGTEAQLPIELTIQRQKIVEQERLKNSGDRPAIEKNLSELQAANEAIAKLFKAPTIKGNQLKDAFPDKAAGAVGDNWNVSLRFNDEGGKNFAELTKNLAGTGRSIGVFLDNQLLSAPTVGVEFAETGIMGGSAIITGSFTAQEAQDLSVQLRGGALPVPVEIVENRTVGASLGRDSIQRSIYAGLGGLILVLIFMVVYYRLPGVIADVSLIIYGLLTLACFALLGVTLTLPGIAGFILSIGMAVDANVLIFERTR